MLTWDDDVDLLDAVRQNHFLNLALHEGNDVAEVVGLDDLHRIVGNVGAFDGDDTAGASLRGEHWQDAGARSNIQNSLKAFEMIKIDFKAELEQQVYLSLEQMFVVVHRVSVSHRPDLIFQHLLGILRQS